MLALDCIIAPAVLLYTVFIDSPRYPGYMHLLVTYHFGFVRRAFIGSVLSWFTDAVPLWSVYVIAIAAWIVTLALFVAGFRKVYGFKPREFSVICFRRRLAVLFQEFCRRARAFRYLRLSLGAGRTAHSGGSALSAPDRGRLRRAGADPSPAFFALYPDHRLYRVCSLRPVAGFFDCKAAMASSSFYWSAPLFWRRRVLGRMPVPQETFLAYVRSRAPSIRSIHRMRGCGIRRLAQEMHATWERLGGHALRFPVYAILIALHSPGRPLSESHDRRAADAAHAAQLRSSRWRRSRSPTFRSALSSHDYARWVSSWAVCMFLAMHAIRLLPSTATENAPPLAPNNKTNLVLGWIVAAIPRVGVTIPF